MDIISYAKCLDWCDAVADTLRGNFYNLLQQIVSALNRLHALHRCGLLLHVSHVCLSVCVLSTRLSCTKTAEPSEKPFRGLIYVGPRNHVVDGARLERCFDNVAGVYGA